MGVSKSSYMYGQDADGRRGVLMDEWTVTSDISGDELDEDDIYEYDGQLCSRDELLELLDFQLITSDEVVECSDCNENIDPGTDYYLVDDQILCEECFDQMIEDDYHISFESACDRHYYSYEDYLEDHADDYRDEF